MLYPTTQPERPSTRHLSMMYLEGANLQYRLKLVCFSISYSKFCIPPNEWEIDIASPNNTIAVGEETSMVQVDFRAENCLSHIG